MANNTQKRKLSTNNILGMIESKPGSCPIGLLLSVIAGDRLKDCVKIGATGKVRTKIVTPSLALRVDCAKTVLAYIAPKLSTQQVTMDVEEEKGSKGLILSWKKAAND